MPTDATRATAQPFPKRNAHPAPKASAFLKLQRREGLDAAIRAAKMGIASAASYLDAAVGTSETVRVLCRVIDAVQMPDDAAPAGGSYEK